MRPALGFTAVASILAVITALVGWSTATESTLFVNQLLVFTVLIFAGSLVLGVPSLMAGATVPLLGVVMIEARFGDDPTWTRSLILGCLWFVTIEAGREALDRRNGSSHTRAAAARRVQEITLVILLSLVVGVVSVAVIEFAPVRTVLLQALILGLVLAAFVMLIRRIATPSTDAVQQPIGLD